MREVIPTRSEALALSEERQLLRDGHHFLDEKRTLLAGEMLRQLAVYDDLKVKLDEARQLALASLGQALERHGLDELQTQPQAARLMVRKSVVASFLGVRIMRPHRAADPVPARTSETEAGPLPTPELREARAAFIRLARLSCEAGRVAGNLMRLAHEYRRTERRAKALENVLMPELDVLLKHLLEQLDSMDQEEAVGVRVASRSANQLSRS